MKKKATILLVLTCWAGTAIFAQAFMQSAGVNFSIMTAKIATASNRYTATVSFANLTYFPKFTVTESENSSVSIGIPVGLGIGIASDVLGGETTVYYGVDLPLAVDFNMGRKSTNENEDGFGWYIGSGFGYTLTNWTDGSSTEKLNSYGPLFRAGVRFTAGSDHPEWATTVGLSFKPGLESTKFKTFGIGVFIDF
jgi:hypothetical protein